jgi:acetolactate synthase-1/2/3 large subunit
MKLTRAQGPLYDGGMAAEDSMRVYRALAEEIRSQGVEQTFGLMGEDTAKLIVELDRLGIPFTATRHENQAVGAADAYARVSGKLGVALLTSGPGFTNALTLITTASRAGSRLVVIVGARLAREDEPGFESARRGKYFPYLATCEAEGIAAIKLRDAVTAIADSRRAFALAASGTTVVLNVPVDVLEAEAEARSEDASILPSVPSATPRAPDDDQITVVADLLQEAWAVSRPIILAGRGAVRADAGTPLRRLGELIGAAFATTLPAVGLFAGEEYDLGLCGTFSTSVASEVITRSDCVLVFGASLHTFTTYGGSLLDRAQVIQVDDDERAFNRFVKVDPDLAVLADTRLAAEALVEKLEQRGVHRPGLRTAELRRRITDYAPTDDFRDQSLDDEIDPRTLMVELDLILPQDRLVIVDPGHHVTWSAKYLHVPRPQDFLMPIEFGSIGVGVGAAIGAASAYPMRTTVLGVGDGALMMALGDVETMVRYGLPVVIVVSNDLGLGAEVHYLDLIGEPSDLAKHSTPSFAAVAQALGGEGYTVRSIKDLAPLVTRFRAPIRGPIVLDCYINRQMRGDWVELAHGRRNHASAPR